MVRSTAVTLGANDALHNSSARAGRFACLNVADTGTGMTPEIRQRLFEPFFTTKEVGKGTGLGLATVFGIVRQHEGWIEVESTLGCGTTFKIFLPESAGAGKISDAFVEVAATVAGRGTILVVEDEPALLDLAEIILSECGYRVHTSRTGARALAAWPALGENVDLLLTDMIMPDGVSGRELARRLVEQKPELKVLFTSGYSADLKDAAGQMEDGINFLPKPYTPAQLTARVRGCLGSALAELAGVD